MLKLGKLVVGDDDSSGSGGQFERDRGAQTPLLPSPREKPASPMMAVWESPETPMFPKYRLRDLLLGDFAFNDDGER